MSASLTDIIHDLIKKQPSGDTVRGAWTHLTNGAIVRLTNQAFYIYRKGETPTTPKAIRAQQIELDTFRRAAVAAGLSLDEEWVAAKANPGFYGARFARVAVAEPLIQ
jgi:hypothetical protein